MTQDTSFYFIKTNAGYIKQGETEEGFSAAPGKNGAAVFYKHEAKKVIAAIPDKDRFKLQPRLVLMKSGNIQGDS